MKCASAEARVRYYLGGVALRGIAFGGTVGGARASYKSYERTREIASGVKLGVGGKRVFYSSDGERLTGAYPTSRIAPGWAF